jgi:uncharacterized protein YecE (DUF72 family)
VPDDSGVPTPTTRSGASLHVGTSGWQYADWRGVLYPEGLPQRRWLERYAEVFDTVEVNTTFYGLPSAATAVTWAETVPEPFLFALKLSRYATHRNDLQRAAAPIHRFMDRLAGIGSHLGPIVVQLPPWRVVDQQGLETILGAFPQRVAVAVELRHPSWFQENSIRALLERHGAALIWADRRGRLQSPEWVTTDWLYLRLHEGRGRAGNYGSRTIDRYAALLATHDKEAYVYFNNDRGGNAVRNAQALVARIHRG